MACIFHEKEINYNTELSWIGIFLMFTWCYMQAKMKAEQFKFLSSISSTADDGRKSTPDVTNTDAEQNSEESVQDVCSLCHDPKSKTPVSYLILLQVSHDFVCLLSSELINQPFLKVFSITELLLLHNLVLFFPFLFFPLCEKEI